VKKFFRLSLLSIMAIAAVVACFIAPLTTRAAHEKYFASLSEDPNTIAARDKEKTAASSWSLLRLLSPERFTRREFVYKIERKGIVPQELANRIDDCPLLTSVRIIDGGDCDQLCANLANSRQLRVLTLTRCELTSAAIVSMKNMESLHLLVLNQTNLTQEQISEIRSALPKTYVFGIDKE